jgi:hypothetical protein
VLPGVTGVKAEDVGSDAPVHWAWASLLSGAAAAPV